MEYWRNLNQYSHKSTTVLHGFQANQTFHSIVEFLMLPICYTIHTYSSFVKIMGNVICYYVPCGLTLQESIAVDDLHNSNANMGLCGESNFEFCLLRTIYDCVSALQRNMSQLLPTKYSNINDILSQCLSLMTAPGKLTEPQP